MRVCLDNTAATVITATAVDVTDGHYRTCFGTFQLYLVVRRKSRPAIDCFALSSPFVEESSHSFCAKSEHVVRGSRTRRSRSRRILEMQHCIASRRTKTIAERQQQKQEQKRQQQLLLVWCAVRFRRRDEAATTELHDWLTD